MSIRTVATATAALAALALLAPPASASHPTVNCRFNAVSQATATGQDTWQGHAQGYVLGAVGEPVAIRCVLRVDGAVRATTPWASGSTVAVTAGHLTYVRALTEVSQLCAQYTTGHGPAETCFPSTPIQVPPEAVMDIVWDVVDYLSYDLPRDVDRFLSGHGICTTLVALAGPYGPVVVAPGGDVYVDGELFWDCPPYEP